MIPTPERTRGEKQIYYWVKDNAGNVGGHDPGDDGTHDPITVYFYVEKPSVTAVNGKAYTGTEVIYLAGHETIIVTFSEAMDLSGGVGILAGSDFYTSPADFTVSDPSGGTELHLDLDPLKLWEENGSSMVISCDSLTGSVPLEATSVTLEVFYGTCADDDGTPGYPGTCSEPLRSIQDAISEAESTYKTALGLDSVVRVADGNYGGGITMVSRVSLLGGFNNDSGDWGTRDPQLFPSTITDTGSTGSEFSPTYAVQCTDVDSLTSIQGMALVGSVDFNATYSTALYCTGSSCEVVVTENTIDGGGDGSHHYRYGVFVAGGAAPLIVSNTIDANGGASVDWCRGVFVYDASPQIEGNQIRAGRGGETAAIYCTASDDPVITRNFLDGGKAPTTYGILVWSLAGSGTCEISNNVILSGEGDTASYCVKLQDHVQRGVRNNTFICNYTSTFTVNSYCLHLGAADSIDNNIFCDLGGQPAVTSWGIHDAAVWAWYVRNNDFHGLDSFYYDGTTSYTSIATMEAAYSDFDDNVSRDPAFSDAGAEDFTLSASTNSDVTTGGLNGSHSNRGSDTNAWTYTYDLTESNRSPLDDSSTTGWSMGAYEY